MKVILKQDVENVGRKGDTVNVAPGFGRNFLLPRNLALAVTASASFRWWKAHVPVTRRGEIRPRSGTYFFRTSLFL